MSKRHNRTGRFTSTARTALLIVLSPIALAGCTTATMPVNRSLESAHQPVIQRTNYTFDLVAGPEGLAPTEARRLAGWFEALDLHYGDRIAIDDPVASHSTRSSVEAVVSRFGMILSEAAPETPGYVNAGTVRVVVSRSTASVPHCPDWDTKTDRNFNNATASGYGCSVNGNLAAMIANPEDLVKGNKSASETTVMSSDKAINSFRSKALTGDGGLKATSSKGE